MAKARSSRKKAPNASGTPVEPSLPTHESMVEPTLPAQDTASAVEPSLPHTTESSFFNLLESIPPSDPFHSALATFIRDGTTPTALRHLWQTATTLRDDLPHMVQLAHRKGFTQATDAFKTAMESARLKNQLVEEDAERRVKEAQTRFERQLALCTDQHCNGSKRERIKCYEELRSHDVLTDQPCRARHPKTQPRVDAATCTTDEQSGLEDEHEQPSAANELVNELVVPMIIGPHSQPALLTHAESVHAANLTKIVEYGSSANDNSRVPASAHHPLRKFSGLYNPFGSLQRRSNIQQRRQTRVRTKRHRKSYTSSEDVQLPQWSRDPHVLQGLACALSRIGWSPPGSGRRGADASHLQGGHME